MYGTNEHLAEWVRKAEEDYEATVEEAREAVKAMKTVRRFVRNRLGLPE